MKIVHRIGGLLKEKRSLVMFMCVVKPWLFIGIQVNLKYEKRNLLMAMYHLLKRQTQKRPILAKPGIHLRGWGTCGCRCQCRWPWTRPDGHLHPHVTHLQEQVTPQVPPGPHFACFCLSLIPKTPLPFLDAIINLWYLLNDFKGVSQRYFEWYQLWIVFNVLLGKVFT